MDENGPNSGSVSSVCVCVINVDEDEGQSLNEQGSCAMFNVGNISNYEINNELTFIHSSNSHGPTTRVKPWNQSCDPVPIRGAIELLSKFLSKSVAEENFYFIFSEVQGRPDCDRNNSRNDDSKSSCLASVSDTYTSKNGECVNSTFEEGGSVFGSPLKLEPIADISLNETTSDCVSTISVSDPHPSRLVGLPVFEARTILSRFCQMKGTDLKDSLLKTVVILCDCDGIHSTVNDKIILLGARRDIDDGNRKLTTFKVTFGNKKHNLSFLEPLHLASGSVCPMKCSYDLLEQKYRKQKMKIEAYWPNCHGNSIISNLHTARLSLHMAAPFGLKDSPLYHHLSRLKHVLLLCKGLKDGELPSVLSTKSYNAVENLQNLFMRIQNGMQESKSPVKEGGKGKRINLASSYNADITDDLWEIFSQCESYQDMVACLKMTFNTFKKCEFPLFVRNDNDTLLARLVRQSSSGLTYFPPLTNLMPLKIITELGLEQMKKIYTAILLQNELCSKDDIENFLKDSLREDTSGIDLSISVTEPDHQMKESLVETVKKLHHCIELSCFVDLHIENLQLKAVATHILNHFRLNALDDSYCFVIPLDSRSASQEVEKLSPSMVRREYTVEGQCRVECLVSEMPEELVAQTLHQQLIASDTSISINESGRECYKFMTVENVSLLGGSS